MINSQIFSISIWSNSYVSLHSLLYDIPPVSQTMHKLVTD